MSNTRYFVPETLINPYFTEEEIKDWNTWVKHNYRVFIRFERIAKLKLSAKAKKLSARGILYSIREQTHWSIKNACSPFLAFMYCCKYPEEKKYFNQKKKKQ